MTFLGIVAGLCAAAHFILKAYGPRGLTVAILVPVALIGLYAAKLNYEVYRIEQQKIEGRAALDAIWRKHGLKK